MKKITLTIFTLILSYAFWAQNSTGPIVLSPSLGYVAQLDISSSLVTLNLIGPSNGYLALGFGVTNMINNGDCVIYTEDEAGASLRDSSFNGNTSTPSMDTQQDWTIIENTITDGTRRIIATRALDTGNTDDYVFTETMDNIVLTWAHRPGIFGLGYHGAATRGATTSSITLSAPQFDTKPELSVYPNPSRDLINVSTSNLSNTKVDLEVYSVLGQKVYSETLNGSSSIINTSQWNSGIYLVKLSSLSGNVEVLKRFVKL